MICQYNRSNTFMQTDWDISRVTLLNTQLGIETKMVQRILKKLFTTVNYYWS